MTLRQTFGRALKRLAPEAKASRTAKVLQFDNGGRARWTPRDYAALAREGFLKNAIVHRCVKLVAENVAAAPYLVYEGAHPLATHPLLELIARPNPRDDRAGFLESIAASLLVAGNAYIEAVAIENAVRELYVLRADRMRVVPGPDGWPQAYDYVAGGQTVRFDQAGALPPILHLKLFHPLDDHYGFAPLEAAAVAVDVHNAAAVWNKALLDNAARPSGALVYSGPEGAVLADNQFERLKRELEETYQGAKNAGRPLLLEGGYTNHPADPGGPTNFGITIADYRLYKMRNATADDVKAMRLDDAKEIYRAKYWNVLRCDALPTGVDYCVFDYGVNSGVGRAGKVLRRVLALSADDWQVTDAVLVAVRTRDAQTVIAAICDERLAFLKSLRTWPTFGAGWSRRVADVRGAALAMARGSNAVRPSPPPSASAGTRAVPTAKIVAGTAAAGGVIAAHHGWTAVSITFAAVFIVAACGWFWFRRKSKEMP